MWSGPPPTGFQTIAPKPANHLDTAFGRFISLALDSNGDPATAFVYADPNGDGRYDDTQLMFVSWDRAANHWKEPVSVATMGNYDGRPPVPCVSLAHDPQTGAYGAVWVDPGNKIIHLALSRDDGATWTEKPALTDTRELGGPTLAFAGGKANLAVWQVSKNIILYLTGAIDEEPGQWKSTPAPMFPGNNAVARGSSLALDESGAPALAYWQKANNSPQWTLAYWRPGQDAPLKVADTGASTYPPDGVLLTFAGAQPRIVLDSRLDRAQISSHYSVASSDGGATWTKPSPIPDDGNEHIAGFMSLAVARDGRALFAGDVIGGNTQGMKCSWPKISRSADFVSWTTCAPQNAQYPQIRTLYGSVIHAPSGVFYLVFQNGQKSPQQGLAAGIIVWGGR